MCLVLAEQICCAAAAEQVPRFTTANTSTDMLMWACKKYCCCTYNIYEITPIYNTWNYPIAYLYRWSWGRWRVSEAHCNCYSKHWPSIWMLSSKLIGCWCEKNQSSAPCDNDVIISDWVNRCFRPEAALHRMINVWHQSIARAIRKLKDPSALLSLSRYFDVILCSAASSRTRLKSIGLHHLEHLGLDNNSISICIAIYFFSITVIWFLNTFSIFRYTLPVFPIHLFICGVWLHCINMSTARF